MVNIARFGRLWATTGNLNDGEVISAKKVVEKKKVKFQPAVRVVLIPSRTEYATADILVELWWDDSDYSAFKTSAVTELKALMKSRGLCNSKEAIRILYQPNTDDEIVGFESSPTSVSSKSTKISSSPPAPTIEDFEDSPPRMVCSASELELAKLAFLGARTDLDLTNPVNFDKINSPIHDAHAHVNEAKNVHPLAYMCE